MKPLDGLLVLDFSQFLAGPSAALRLADLGARVIKIERPGTGDLARQLYNNELELDGDSTLFHSINRNKESIALNLKDPHHLDIARRLIEKADVMIQNFRPGVMERLGLGYSTVRDLNPRLIYAEVTGYGKIGPWRNKPGQDLLLQALSGLTWLSGNADQPPMPFGLAVVDMFAGAHLVQGILACLVRRGITGKGGLVEVSLLESIIDFQFEVFTTYLNDGRQLPRRSKVNNANAYLPAPYGIYATADGYLALAMGSVVRLGELLNCPALLNYPDPRTWFSQRDEIKQILVDHLKTRPTADWLKILEPAGWWCAEVLTWPQLVKHDGFKTLKMLQTVSRAEGVSIKTTRCPIRIDGQIFTSPVGAPRIGQHTRQILSTLQLPIESQHE
ncbi:MAG: CoA transferase [Chloroflexi bacterium]|nr:MAG: CoA transferase [Chloroflexota bacterium]